jgi:hypothetical protein
MIDHAASHIRKTKQINSDRIGECVHPIAEMKIVSWHVRRNLPTNR